MCEHSPLSADDCKPNKALRLTVKAFLKSEEKKRDKGRTELSSSKINQQDQSQSNAAPGESDASRTIDAPGGSDPSSNNVLNATSDLNAPKCTTDVVVAGQGNDKVSNVEISECFKHTHGMPSQIDSQNEASNAARAASGEPSADLARNDAGTESYAGNLANEAEDVKNKFSNDLGANDGTSNGQSVQFHGQSNYGGMQVEQNGMEWPNMGEYNSLLQSQNGMPNMNWNWMPNMMGKITEQVVSPIYMLI